jgi:hypothetical protein
MNKYVCSNVDNGTGDMIIANSPEEAFNEYREYFDLSVSLEDVYIYRLSNQLQGTVSYSFTEVGT